MVAEMLSILVKTSRIRGLKVLEEKIVRSQLADDTTLFLENVDQIPLALQTIDFFLKGLWFTS